MNKLQELQVKYSRIKDNLNPMIEIYNNSTLQTRQIIDDTLTIIGEEMARESKNYQYFDKIINSAATKLSVLTHKDVRADGMKEVISRYIGRDKTDMLVALIDYQIGCHMKGVK